MPLSLLKPGFFIAIVTIVVVVVIIIIKFLIIIITTTTTIMATFIGLRKINATKAVKIRTVLRFLPTRFSVVIAFTRGIFSFKISSATRAGLWTIKTATASLSGTAREVST